MKKPVKSWLIAASVASLLAAPVVSQANAEVEKLIKEAANWATWGGDYAGTRYSTLTQINSQTAKSLQPVWTFSTGALRGHEGGPLVVNGTIYIHTGYPHKIYALDQDTQTIKWEYQYSPDQGTDPTQVISVMCCDVVNRGLAYGDGKIFIAQGDATLVALDATTGKQVWRIKNGDPKLGQTNTNAPIVVKDKVITGISGGEFGVRGYIAAYNIKDGSLAWKAYSIGPDDDLKVDPEKTTTWTDGKVAPVGKDSSLKTWQGDQWKIGGGTTWGWYSYDAGLNSIYYGSGNPSTWNPVQRPGDNKWSMTIWSRDVDTGKANWVYQMTPHDEWDYDGINEMTLIDLPLKDANGKEHTKLLTHFDRNGFGYTLDRATGELLVAEKFDKAVNWATHVDLKSGRPQVVSQYSTQAGGEDHNQKGICPSAMGSKNQPPVTFSPKTKLIYIPGNHTCMDYEPFQVEYTAGQPYVGATLNIYPAKVNVKTGQPEEKLHMGSFTAWDPTTGKIAWQFDEPFSLWSGFVSTAGDVVIYGTLEGYLKVRDANTGAELYKFKTPSGIIGNVSTWAHNGKQYVGVLSGLGGWAGVGEAAGLEGATEGLGAVGAYKGLKAHGKLGGVFTVFALPNN
ncbi:methanol/ethanol family PQQ-dependent dehydrogenase [Methylococcus sp. EFPC2]|uniref:methanol/ethanol family PQQ-dependent dehydrogenase n=1 Tax=Methylococcus sp. EFPC2 TaxID=2812648 RepID=UPI001967B165|nr:methanol/ethanol family PQQ-dependent dehydrogenase [Methylococcus sp. EFPC2]QSA98636.1 methanol/ethanol family PQQ-dependent dehydrogenase [Methylococcus sp. EFPC2]